MKVSFFIDRPVFSAVISILIVIVGIIGLMMLPNQTVRIQVVSRLLSLSTFQPTQIWHPLKYRTV